MRRRLVALLVVALISGTAAGTTVASAKEQLDTMVARIPALPPLSEVANACPS